VADFYRGKNLRIVVGSSAGGGYDTYARLIARYLGKYVPGEPTVVVENVPGAGSVLAMKQVYGGLPRDGTVIGSVIGSTVSFDQMFSNPTDYDMRKVQYLGAPTSDKFALFVASRSGVTKVEDMIGPNAKPIATGSNATSGDMGTATAVYFNKYLGAQIKNVTGYGGTAQVRLAVDSGELDGMVNSWQSHLATTKEKVDSGEWHVMAQLTMDPIPNGPAGVPTLAQLAKTQEERDVARLYTLPNDYARPFFVAPEVPGDRVAALRRAFGQALDDPEFRAEAAKAQLEVAPLTGDQLQTIVTEFLSVPDTTKAQLKAVLAP
jgi:tripartite-type tricarboxylate transporter receptor subunit TctC